MGDEFDWPQLLRYVQEQRVIPVLGPELLKVKHGGREVLLDRLIAEHFCDAVGLKIQDFPDDAGLSVVVRHHCQSAKANGSRRQSFVTLFKIWQSLHVEVPRALQQVAEITDFNFFVSTTTDSLLAEALNVIRAGERGKARTISFSLRKGVSAQDTDAFEPADPPLVFQLFGSVSGIVGDYVVTDEDMLEFMYRLQSEPVQLPKIFSRIRDSDLLLIGCDFSDWLTRFFLRNLSNVPLGSERDRAQTIVPEPSDRNLIMFLQDANVHIASSRGAEEFVDQLHARWKAAQEKPVPVVKPSSDSRSVFLSYARKDRQKVLMVKRALEEANISVWCDDRLEAGDDFKQVIEQQIRSCSIFVPCISQTTVQPRRRRAWFYFEWNTAIEDGKFTRPGVKYLHPIVLDETPPDSDGIPPEFRDRHMPRFEGGAPPASFAQQIRKSLDGLGPREGGALS